MAASCSPYSLQCLVGQIPPFYDVLGDFFLSPVVGRRCFGLFVACTFDVFLTGYNATVADGSIAHFGLGMACSRFCREQDKLSVVVYD